MAELNFWQNLVEKGIIDSFDDGAYYYEGRAGEGEYAHAIQVAFNNTEPGSEDRVALIDALYEGGAISGGDRSYWYGGTEDTIGRDFENLGTATETFFQRSGGTIDVAPTAVQDPAAEGPVPSDAPGIVDPIIEPEAAAPAVGEGAAAIPGVMAGGTIHRIQNPAGQVDFYVISYEYPPGSGHAFYYRFNSLEALDAAVGPNLGGGAVAIGDMLPEDALTGWTDGGDSNEIVGIQGSFNGYLDDLVRDVTIAAGLDDPTLVGAALRDPDIALILAKTAEGEWTPFQSKAALRQTDYYKDVLYPGIENFYAQTDNPEALYAMYTQNVNQTLKSLGTPQDADGSYKSTIANLLDKGVTDTAFGTFATTYKQAQTNVGFASALNEWTERYTGQSVSTFEDYFDVLAGNAPAEVQEIAELAGIQFMAENVGFEITEQEIRTLGESLDLSQEEAGRLFSATARDLLALGERGLRRGDLTSTQVLEAEAGIGGNVEKIKLRMTKLAREEGLSDDPTATIFTDFNREGAPVKKGLQSTISEGA